MMVGQLIVDGLATGLLLALPGATLVAEPEKKDHDGPVSYYRDVRRIFQQHPDGTQIALREFSLQHGITS